MRCPHAASKRNYATLIFGFKWLICAVRKALRFVSDSALHAQGPATFSDLK